LFDAFRRSYEAFKHVGVEDPAMEALRLVDILSTGKVREIDVSLPQHDGLDLPRIAEARKTGVPLEYAVGEASFGGIGLYCTPDTLIPREETELLLRVALQWVRQLQGAYGQPLTLADIGTGSGNLAIAMAMNTETPEILASDISPAAIAVAKRNVERYHLQERVTLYCGDMLVAIKDDGHQQLDMIVCNPPYMPTASLAKLDPEILDHEPEVALNAGAYGLDAFRSLFSEAPAALRSGGVLAFEIGHGQEQLATSLLRRNGSYTQIEYHRDADDAIRVISACRI
jgi:release factor glutamine methyltransferase